MVAAHVAGPPLDVAQFPVDVFDELHDFAGLVGLAQTEVQTHRVDVTALEERLELVQDRVRVSRAVANHKPQLFHPDVLLLHHLGHLQRVRISVHILHVELNVVGDLLVARLPVAHQLRKPLGLDKRDQRRIFLFDVRFEKRAVERLDSRSGEPQLAQVLLTPDIYLALACRKRPFQRCRVCSVLHVAWPN